MLKFMLAVCGVILGWIFIVPAFEFPDEQAHFGTVSTLIDSGSMPKYGKSDLSLEMAESQKLLGIFRDGNGNNKYTYHPEYHVEYGQGLVGIYEPAINQLNNVSDRNTYVGSEAAKYPPLYYRYISFYTWLSNSRDILTRLYATRLGGIDLVAVMAIIVWQTGLILFKKRVYAATLTFLVMLQPMMSFVTAGINSDNLHNLFFFLILYLSLKIIRDGLKIRDLIFIALTIALDIYTKPQGFIGIPISAIAVLIAVIKTRKWKMLLWIIVIGIATLILGASQWQSYSGLFTVSNVHNITFIDYLRFSANKLIAQNVVWYWGVFKWLGVVMPPIYWRVANRLVLLSLVGILIYWWKIFKNKKTSIDPYAVSFMLLASVSYALTIFWYDWQHTKQNGYSLGIQARYFFPTIVAHMTILITGITSIGWNSKIRKLLRQSLVLFFAWLQLGGIWHLISIYYPGPKLSDYLTQFSQYKPMMAKGEWWYLWIGIYMVSFVYLVKTLLFPGMSGEKLPRQK